jgi:hypothetical protein
MTMISFAAPHHVAIAADRSLSAVALFSCLGLLASVCLMTFGVDLGTGWL